MKNKIIITHLKFAEDWRKNINECEQLIMEKRKKEKRRKKNLHIVIFIRLYVRSFNVGYNYLESFGKRNAV